MEIFLSPRYIQLAGSLWLHIPLLRQTCSPWVYLMLVLKLAVSLVPPCIYTYCHVVQVRLTVCDGDIFKPQIHTINRFTLASHSTSKTDVFSLGLSNACFKASCLISAALHLHLLSCCTGSPDCNSREVSSIDAGEDEVFMVSKMGCTKQQFYTVC